MVAAAASTSVIRIPPDWFLEEYPFALFAHN
jgi:hypothetical protein